MMLEKPASKTIVDRSRRGPQSVPVLHADGVEAPPAALDSSRGEKQGFIAILNLLGQSALGHVARGFCLGRRSGQRVNGVS
jgi:hypothetical protein